MNNSYKYFVFFLIAIFLIPVVTNLFLGQQNPNQISYSRFRQEVRNGNVTQVVVSGQLIEGTFRGSEEDDGRFSTFIPSFGDPDLLNLLEEQDVQVRTEPEQDYSVLGLLLNFLPIIIFVWIGIILFRSMRQQGRSMFQISQNKAKLYKKTKERVTFENVAGVAAAKEEIKEIVDYLKHPDRYKQLDARTPKGVLLIGPPGTGKTLIARAIAGEADVPFYSISGSDFMEMFVGVGASRVRKLFEEAKKNSPSIIFVDELDSIGRHRGAGLGGGHDEREQTLNQLLSEMDGFEQSHTTIVIAATNRPDILDPALLRPGRFDRRLTIGLPSMQDRVDILKIHGAKKPLDSSVDFQEIARGCPGFSGADLENLLNEAALIAARTQKTVISRDDIMVARDKILMGLERRNLVITDEEKKIIAYHEAGHAILAAVLPNADPLHKVTVVPRDSGAMGVTQQLPAGERYVYSRDYLLDRIAVLLGGRAAEDLVINSVSTGAESDFSEATKLAKSMVNRWGMSDKIGPMALGGDRKDVFLGEEMGRPKDHSEETMREADVEIRHVLTDGYRRAMESLTEKRKVLEQLAERLLKEEEVSGQAVLEMLGITAPEALAEANSGSPTGPTGPAEI
ncbi:MAG: ATP-dependent zinc metalloprotease FtsH [Spirochaetaceae bacterium]